MHKYVIERELPGAGKLSPEELRAVAQKSNGVIEGIGKKIQWVHSYVVDDKIYCIYNADSPKTIEEHAVRRLSGQPDLARAIDHRSDNRRSLTRPLQPRTFAPIGANVSYRSFSFSLS